MTLAEANEAAVAELPRVKRLAYYFARRTGYAVEVEELYAVGALAAVEASRRYRDDQGATFGTFAAARVCGAMRDYMRQTSPWTRSGEPRPTVLSYDAHVASSGTIGEEILRASLARLAEHESILTVETAMRTLPARVQEVLALYYGDGLLMREVGARLGLTEGRVSQIHKCALAELRERAMAC